MRVATSTVAIGTVLLGAFLRPPMARAQDLGVFAGVSSATIAFLPSGSQNLPGGDRRTGFAAGVSFSTSAKHRAGVQIEAIVHQMGVRNLFSNGDEIRFTYFELPILLRLNVVTFHSGRVYFVAGATPAFNLRASYSDDMGTHDIRDNIRTGDLGLAAGGGVEIGHVTVGARYTWGLVSPIDIGGDDGSFKNRTFVATAGVRFGR